jgi:hypothetical protein
MVSKIASKRSAVSTLGTYQVMISWFRSLVFKRVNWYRYAEDAQRELTKADKSQKAARNKMICLAIVIAVVLIVLILFLLQ